MADHSRTAGGILAHRGRVVLLRKRLNHEVRLPKGGIDPGETPAQAALREVTEETGFGDLAILADLGEEPVAVKRADGWRERTQHFHLMRLRSFRRFPRGSDDARRFDVFWAGLEEALELISFAAERQALQQAVAALARGDGDG